MVSQAFVVLSLFLSVCAHMDDPSMSPGAMNGTDMGGMASGDMMKPWLHFTVGDALWFKSWVPQSKGALAGAAIGLFLLAVVERWLASMRALMELHWQQQMQRKVGARGSESQDEKSVSGRNDSGVVSLPNLPDGKIRLKAPFILAHNAVRALMFTLDSALNYLFMLAIMTYQVAFFISIVAGLGLGEFLFGRFAHISHSSDNYSVSASECTPGL